jgi:hypothetical protein
LVGIGITISPAFAAALAGVSLLALAAWLALSWRTTAGHDSIVGPCLLAIVMVTVLATCRYLSGVVPLLAGIFKPLFATGFAITESTWFVVFVVAPITLMLLGAYYLARRSPLGLYMAWWTAIYAIADGLMQFAPQWRAGVAYDTLYFGSALVAVAQIFAGAITCQRLLRTRAVPVRVSPASTLTLRQRNLWTLLFVSLVAVYAVALFRQGGPLPLMIGVGSMVGGLIGWRLTTALRPADPAWAVPMYLLLLTLFYVHVGDEALTSFNQGIASPSGKPWNDHDYIVLIGLVGPVVWFFAAWSLWKRQPLGNFVFWFFIVGMILGEPTHLLLFPLVAMNKFGIGYEYFSGMYTALFPMIPAIMALVTTVDEQRRRAVQVVS